MATPILDQSLRMRVLMHLLRPVVRFCLRHSQSIQEFVSAAKVVFVEIAQQEMSKSTSKINVSRLSVMTGVHRAEVHKIFRERRQPLAEPMDVLGRVIGKWNHDPDWTTRSKTPRILSCEGDKCEFNSLVREVTQAVHPGTVLFELTRLGLVEKTPKGLKMKKQMLSFASNPVKGFELLAHDIDALVKAVEENLAREHEVSNLHIRTEYDNVIVARLPEVRRWIAREGKAFHKKVRNFLAKHDKDLAPKSKASSLPGGARVTVTAFSLTALPGQNAGESEQTGSAST